MSSDDHHEGTFTLSQDMPPEEEIHHLRDALATRTTLGQATGMIAVSKGLTTLNAWAALVTLSNMTNVKVARLAELLVSVHNGSAAGTDGRVVLLDASRLDDAVARVEAKRDARKHVVDLTSDSVPCGPPHGAA